MADVPGNGITTYRINRIEADLKDLDGVPERMNAIEANVNRLEGAIQKLTWAIVGFAFTVAGSAVALLITSSHP